MKKLLSVLFFAASACASAQPVIDTIALSSLCWEKTEVADGIMLKTVRARFFNSDQAVYCVDIDTNIAKLDFRVGVPGSMKYTSTAAKEYGAIVAINGTYFNMTEGYNRHFIKVSDTVVSVTEVPEFRTRATGVFTVTGRFADISAWTSVMEEAAAGDADDALVCGPVLIDGGIDMPMWDSPFVTARHPRSLVGCADGGHILFVVVDGRQPGYADGMNLFELRALARALDCHDALNLDGGGSSALYLDRGETKGVVNRPSGKTERAVPSIIYAVRPQ